MRHTISIIILLAVIWLFNSGHYTALINSLGLFSVLFVTYVAHRMDVIDHESQPVHLTTRIPFYYFWLFKQIVLANIDVVKRIWTGQSSINPQLDFVPASQRTDMGKVIYANSITLTPGTVTIDIQGDKFLVHALTEAGIEELKGGEMDRRVGRLED